MSLYEKLQKVSSEEDVKDIYIKALGLKEVQTAVFVCDRYPKGSHHEK